MTKSQKARLGRTQSLDDIRKTLKTQGKAQPLQKRGSKIKESEWKSLARIGITGDRLGKEDKEEALDTLGELSFHQDASVRQRKYSGGSTISTDSARTGTSRLSEDSYGTVESTNTAVSRLSQSTSSSSSASTAPNLFDPSQKDAVKYTETIPLPSHTLTEYLPHECEPNGPRYCQSTEFRMFDPYCPQRYRCKDYEIEAVWFDGRNAGDLRFTIDLEHGTMDKLPDIRPYLYYMGYWGHWEIEGAGVPSGLYGLTRAQTEEYYVKRGRVFLMYERRKGWGYFLGKRDWSSLVEDWGRLAWTAFWRTDATDQDVGMDDGHEGNVDRDQAGVGVLKTNVRASMPYPRQVRVRPGDDDWDAYIQWLYNRFVHGLDHITRQHNTAEEVFENRFAEDRAGRFMILEENDSRHKYY